MKSKFILFYSVFTIVFFSCEKAETEDNSKNNVEDSLKFNDSYLIVGVIDTVGSYCDFEPDILIGFPENRDPNYWAITESISIDCNEGADIEIIREGNDRVDEGTQYYSERLNNLKDFEFVCDSNDYLKPLIYGDTLSAKLNWVKADEYIMMYSDGNSFRGLWNVKFGEDFYLGLRKVERDTTYYWIRREHLREGDKIKFKDCCSKLIEVKE